MFTRKLTKEAAKGCEPAAPRAFYRNLGRGQGAVVGAAAVGVGAPLYNKVSARRTSSGATPAPEPERKSDTDGLAPGEGGDS